MIFSHRKRVQIIPPPIELPLKMVQLKAFQKKYGGVIEALIEFCCQHILNVLRSDRIVIFSLVYEDDHCDDHCDDNYEKEEDDFILPWPAASAPPCPYKRHPPLRTDNTHPGHYLTSNPHSAVHILREKKCSAV